ncbi:MAG: 30S ribosomal protein S17 [Planctomycetota bacterium]|nr:MAG: 30S ribosomal protein S17 [Planctomycetota bacterium]
MSTDTNTAVADSRGNRKREIGYVVSDKMTKTRVVEVVEHYKHPMYGKFLKRTNKFHIHDENNDSKAGDKVMIIETRPLSKTKRWRLMKILERAV